MVFPKKPQLLFSPMLSTFGGGSNKGFIALGSDPTYYIREFGTNNNNYTTQGVAVDSNDNVIVGGYANALSGGPSGDYGWVHKFTKGGSLDWARDVSYANGNAVNFTGVAVDSSDNVFVTGFARVTGSNKDHYVGKYSSNGSLQVADSYGTSSHGDEFGIAIDVDYDDRVVVVGNYDPSGNAGTFQRINNDLQAIVAQKRISGTSSASTFTDVAAYDGNGNTSVAKHLYIGSDENYSNKFSAQVSQMNLSAGREESYVIRFGGSSRTTFGWMVETGPSDGIAFGGQTDIGTTSGAAAWVSLFIADSNGQLASNRHAWSRLIDSSGTDKVTGAALDSSNNVYVVCNCAPSGANGSGNRIGILKFNGSGTLQWSRVMTVTGGFGDPYMTMNSDGNLVIASYFSNTSSRNQGFYMVYPPDGSITGTSFVGLTRTFTIDEANASSLLSVTTETPTFASYSPTFSNSSYSRDGVSGANSGTADRTTNNGTTSIE